MDGSGPVAAAPLVAAPRLRRPGEGAESAPEEAEPVIGLPAGAPTTTAPAGRGRQ